MKKLFALFVALLALAACATPPPPPTANTNAPPAKPVVVALTKEEATAREKGMWEAIQRKDFDAFAISLASDAVEVTPTDINDKAATMAGVKDFEPSEVNFSDWVMVQLDNDAFVVTYSVKVKGKYQGKDFGEQSSRASSAWVNRDGKWLTVYHQECPVKGVPPPPPKAGASPAASPKEPGAPVAATGPDPVVNEKIVWDLFKSRNYDGFASVLGDDFIQVLENGVYDKAAAVAADRFDASKSELSDWKTLKIDDDAALVIYLVKAPGARDERHATIWSSGPGKWVARFHHGTGVEKAPPRPSPSPSASTSPSTSPSPATASPTASPSPK